MMAPTSTTVDRAGCRPATTRRMGRRSRAWSRVVGSVALGGLALALAACEPGSPAEEEPEAAAPMTAEVTSYPMLDRASVVAPAPDGGVWAGTEAAGLVRWQPGGAGYRHHPLPDRFDDELGSRGISSLAVTDRGTVWAATGHPQIGAHDVDDGQGVVRFDGEEWTRWTAADGLPHDRVTSVAVGDDGSVWAATAAGLARYDGDGWTTHAAADGLAHDEAVRVAAGSDNTVWAVTRGETEQEMEFGLARFDGGQWTNWTTGGDLAAEHLGALAGAGDGGVWIDVAFGPDAPEGNEPGIAHFDGEEWTYSRIVEGPQVRNVESLAVADDGIVWAGTHSGVYRFDGADWGRSRSGDGLGDRMAASVVVGDDGAVWAATPDGVWHYDGDAWTDWATDTSPPDRIWSMAAADDGTVWAALDSGLARFDGEQWTTYGPEDEEALRAPMGYVVAAGDDGTVWTASSDPLGGVARFDGQGWRAETHGGQPAGAAVDALAIGDDGAVWAAHSEMTSPDDGPAVGLSRFDGQQWTTWTGEDGVPDTTVTALASGGDGVVWAGTQQSGVWRFDGETWTTYTDADGLASREVNDVAVAGDGTLWAATRGGVSRFDGREWTTFADDHGLPANQVNEVTLAGDGTVWAAVSNHSRIPGGGTGGLSAFDGEQWTTWTADDGLTSNWVTAMAVDGGAVWVATPDGLSRVTPRR